MKTNREIVPTMQAAKRKFARPEYSERLEPDGRTITKTYHCTFRMACRIPSQGFVVRYLGSH